MPEQEIQRLEECLAWALSVHAATMEGLPKKTSKREKERHIRIAQKLSGFLKGMPVERIGYYPYSHQGTIDEAIVRANDAIERLKGGSNE